MARSDRGDIRFPMSEPWPPSCGTYPLSHHSFLGHLRRARPEISVTYRTLDPRFTHKASVRTSELPPANRGPRRTPEVPVWQGGAGLAGQPLPMETIHLLLDSTRLLFHLF
ncbi:hypothetical protein BDM02DRAFT_2694159 [Thelephora ganbajun]|uniref:Uncharacterized protein n=1 Tax=Thelephora ganbajun TaxID=370292 RepID=A0ACB6ZCT1_THEGA|nr:hypothetical protein BDM02DRAFT_2694159 [Thelephora ganbajun]